MANGRVIAFRRLAEDLREQILEGKFGEDQPLPTEDQLVTAHVPCQDLEPMRLTPWKFDGVSSHLGRHRRR